MEFVELQKSMLDNVCLLIYFLRVNKCVPSPGESIQIFAEIENCSSRMVVPKAAIYQTQAFYAKGKMKEVKQLVANLRGESLSSGKTETWNGKLLKIPPVSPSILDCSIIRVEYSLMVSVTVRCSCDFHLESVGY